MRNVRVKGQGGQLVLCPLGAWVKRSGHGKLKVDTLVKSDEHRRGVRGEMSLRIQLSGKTAEHLLVGAEQVAQRILRNDPGRQGGRVQQTRRDRRCRLCSPSWGQWGGSSFGFPFSFFLTLLPTGRRVSHQPQIAGLA